MLTELKYVFEDTFHDFLQFLPKIFIAVVVFLIFWFVGNLVRNLIRNRKSIFGLGDKLIMNFIGSLTKGIIMLIGFSISLSVLGLSGIASGLVTGAGVSAVILGFAFKNVGENLISGVMLIINRPFSTGDLIEVAGFMGTVVAINLKSTDVRTVDGKIVFIPNTMIINNPLVNYTAEGKRRFEFEIEVDISNEMGKCRHALEAAIAEVPEILQNPKPVIVLQNITSNLRLKVYYWLAIGETVRNVLEIGSDAIEKSKQKLKDAGIDISNVSYLYLTNDSVNIEVVGPEKKSIN